MEPAANLFSAVEEGIVPGCAPRGVPGSLALPGTLSGLSPIDALAEARDDARTVLVAALRDEVRCKPVTRSR